MNKRHILCYGDSNTWGFDAANAGRFDDDLRWTMQLARLLGEEWLLAENGVNGRTTVFEDPINEGLNGLEHLTPAMRAHAPLDLLVVMLGTNDCKQRFSATAQNIADGLRRLVLKAQTLLVWRALPRILVVAPMIIDPRIYDTPEAVAGMGAGCVEKSRALPALMTRVAQETGCDFMDSNPHVMPCQTDWMHLSPQSNAPLAAALHHKILEMMG